MKRYEKYSGAEIVALMEKCMKARFYDDGAECPIGKCEQGVCGDDCLLRWLQSENVMVPRWQTIKSQEDIEKIAIAFYEFCRTKKCDKCRFGHSNTFECYHDYLSELVESEGGAVSDA